MLSLTAIGCFGFVSLLYGVKMVADENRYTSSQFSPAEYMLILKALGIVLGVGLVLADAYLVRQILRSAQGQPLIRRWAYGMVAFIGFLICGAFIESSCIMGYAWMGH